MELRKALHERKSCRAFSQRPVPKEVLTEVLEDAVRAPSAINMQPWTFTVVSGEERPRLSQKLHRAYRERNLTCGPGSSRPLPDAVKRRRIEAAEGMAPLLRKMNVDPHVFVNEGSLDFYGAPAAIIVSFDEAFTAARLFDMGVATGYLLLSAHDHGLATCPVGLVCQYRDVLKEFLNIREDHDVAIAVAIGYPEERSPINEFKSSRDSLSQFVRWYD